MPEIRQNMATKQWVIISTERARRPEEFIDLSHRPVHESLPTYDPVCPFCPGNEEGPDMEVLRLPQGADDWQVRVVKNKYPALTQDGERVRQFDGVNRSISGVGYHEVVVESRLHNTTPALLEVEQLNIVLMAFQTRGVVMSLDDRIEHVIYFKNHGPRAGTSLLHPHSQIIGLPVVPYNVRGRDEEARRFFDDTGACVYCAMLADELKERSRLISENDDFVAFQPYAALSPFHTWIMPREHHPSFLMVSPVSIRRLAEICRDILRRFHFGLNDPDYNIVLRSAPVKAWYADHLHWYVSVIPRVTQTAGFELGSGMYINTALPEHSAAFLRSIQV
ncbi:MAG TPA: galactose-1-phosphate uridylyltransferase [Anaerolineae bacterium]|nr:galactose-1-phosphate uridylyltransferase [Anaerolineae bacterium]